MSLQTLVARRFLMLVALIVWALLTGPSAAQITFTEIVGGPGGTKFADTCGASQALSAINFTRVIWIDSIGPVCQKATEGTPQGPLVGLSTWGRPHGGLVDQLRCPANMFADGITVRVSIDKYVIGFALLCRNLLTMERGMSPYPRGFPGQAQAYEEVASCGGDAFAIGVAGRAGGAVDGLGLVCRTVTPVRTRPQPTPPAQTQPKPELGKPAHQIDDGDNGDQNADPRGSGAAAATDTTIYDQPEGNDVAYLSAGDRVTIVGCNGDNWCQISKPLAGWVWGDDLKR